ncbi:MAG TPA: long-chain fatty acid--CoA ligase [Bacteroidetes bacterium]|nr:long-chain fatty acid--CoA ligase [Bacteroidota bacterium]HIL58328.1 long-chain fatty acid--CoA ligase [Rhodothermales bacterium]
MTIHTAPPDTHGVSELGRTLPSLLDEAAEKYPNPSGFNQPAAGGWRTLSNGAFRDAADEVAVGLLENGISRGDHVAFFMDSDMYFAMADFGTLIAGIVNVPLYTTYAPENLVYVTQHGEAKAMFVSNREMLEAFAEWAPQVPDVGLVIAAEGDAEGVSLPDGVRFMTLDALRQSGREAIAADPGRPQALRDQIDAKDLATLIYTSGTTGQPKGVMLTHENISSNSISSFTSISILGHQEEQVVTFLPLTHIFARMLQFASVAWGQSIFFSNPDLVVGHLAEVKPTMFASVPRVLEKVYDKVSLGVMESSGLKKKIGTWALGLAKEYDVSKPDGGLPGWKYALADKLVYSKLRERLGLTRVKAVAVGGAALRADLASSFMAFGIPAYQGYGLTETSPVITVNLPGKNRAGTVGPPIAGVDVAIAEDGEILTRGPHVMAGYYKMPEATADVMDDDGWFHTGDIGEVTDEGYLKITDRKKALFKLSTGKYVIPQPIENALTESSLIEQAVVVGNSRKYCTALLFPNMDGLRVWAKTHGVSEGLSNEALLKDPKVLAEYERLVAEANAGMDHWTQVQRFKLVPELMTVENELLTPTMKVKRRAVSDTYGGQIDYLYDAQVQDGDHGATAIV